MSDFVLIDFTVSVTSFFWPDVDFFLHQNLNNKKNVKQHRDLVKRRETISPELFAVLLAVLSSSFSH